MFNIKEQYKNKNGIVINIDDDKSIKINTEDNRDMTFGDFQTLVSNGFDFIFDYSQKLSDIDYEEKRVCKKCKQSKLLISGYNKDISSKGGYRIICRKCSNLSNSISAKKRRQAKK